MQPVARRTPTILDLAWASSMFWDGRVETLEEQALLPIQAPAEMNQPIDALVTELAAVPGYLARFEAAYPGEGVTRATIGKALAAFERSVVSGPSAFDRWVAGDESSLTPAARRGFALFTGRARCSQCHAGWRLTDDGFYDIGTETSDPGRGAVLPSIAAVQHAFKTPTLRGVAERGPYLHDGSAATLEAVIDFYDRGGDARRASTSSEIHPLGLSAEDRMALKAFLLTLSGVDPPVVLPVLPR